MRKTRLVRRIRIAVVCAGGTVSMALKKVGDRWVSAPPKSSRNFGKALEMAMNPFLDEVEFEYIFYSLEDSINKGPESWVSLNKKIFELQAAGFDAIIVTHGTDTMSFSALALSLGTRGRDPKDRYLHIPVIFTGAQNPVSYPGGDGLQNMQNAVRTAVFAHKIGVADVLVTFRDYIVRGCFSMKISERDFVAFDSPGHERVGKITGHGPTIESNRVILKHQVHSDSGTNTNRFNTDGIFPIFAHPGFVSSLLKPVLEAGQVKLLLITTHGEGNVCYSGKRNMLPIIKEATKRGVRVLITSPYDAAVIEGSHYEAGELARQAGAYHSGALNMVGTFVVPAWMQANFPDLTNREFGELLHSHAV